ncbi:MAG: hypothetical protein ACYCVH_03110 [Ignavibacteriaceae bacterium]
MGYTTIIDIIGSVIAGGILLLILTRTNASAVENSYDNSSDLAVQQSLTNIVQILEYDFRKVGYCEDYKKIPDPTQAILSADSTSIKFIADINNDGSLDTVYYRLGPTSELTSTPNPNDRFLYRTVSDSAASNTKMIVTQFNLLYFDGLGNQISFPITTPSAISSMQITITVQNAEAYNSKYVTSYWRQIRMASRNLHNR